MKPMLTIVALGYVGYVALAHAGTENELVVTSPAFSANGDIPAKYTCEGENVSPPLEWTPGPPNTRSYAIVVDDPDAPRGTFVHWLVTNLPAKQISLAEDTEMANAKYTGPCPPKGRHRYHFRVYALDTILRPVDKKNFAAAIQGHCVAIGELVATYEKVKPSV